MGASDGSTRAGSIELTYTISREDFWEFNKLCLERRRGRRFNVPVFVGSAVSVALLLWALNAQIPWEFVVGLVVLAALTCLPFKGLAKRRIMRLPLDEGTTLGEHFLRIGPEGVFSKTMVSEGIYRWSGIKDVAQTKDHIFMFTDAHMAHIIPKRAFANQSDAEAFVNLANSLRVSPSP